MIEIYLFVNPIGPICYQSELTLLDALSDQRKNTIAYITNHEFTHCGDFNGLPFNGSIRSRIA